jgi:GNAT superfamily N-acetyltransferase
MPLVYRPARAQDLAPADTLVVASINDLTERHGFGSMATARPPNFQLFSLKDDPDGLWVAEDGGDILGFAWSWVCGDVWFLAQLFVDPAQQGRGIGNELLKLNLAACPEIRGGPQGADYFHLQPRLTRPLHPARPVSQDADLFFRRCARARDSRFAERAIA